MQEDEAHSHSKDGECSEEKSKTSNSHSGAASNSNNQDVIVRQCIFGETKLAPPTSITTPVLQSEDTLQRQAVFGEQHDNEADFFSKVVHFRILPRLAIEPNKVIPSFATENCFCCDMIPAGARYYSPIRS